MKTVRFSLLFLFSLSAIFSLSQDIKNDAAAKHHQEMMDIITAKPKLQIKTIGIFVYDGFNIIDAIGPYQVLSQLKRTKVFLITMQKGFVHNQTGLKIQIDTSFADVKQLDILIVPGGAKETFMMTQDTTVLSWIRAIDKTSTFTASVCTGSWILGATDLLRGKNVTTNWYRAAEMMKRYGANFKQERWVRDGKYWTSAGVTAGLDMSLAIVNEVMGEKYTKAVMLDLEYDPHPPYHAGSVTNTDPIVVDMMREMYDMLLQPVIKNADKNKR